MDHNENTETAPVTEETMSVGKVVALIALNIVIRVAVALTVRAIVFKMLERSAARKAKKALKTN